LTTVSGVEKMLPVSVGGPTETTGLSSTASHRAITVNSSPVQYFQSKENFLPRGLRDLRIGDVRRPSKSFGGRPFTMKGE
jgi:hypothetical protein